MKKYILSIAIVLAANFCNAQAYLLRQYYANKDTLRTQVKMSVIDVATERIDTATNASLRLCSDVLANPNDGIWLDMFVYQIVVIVNSVPTDEQVKQYVNALWKRSAQLNTRR